MFDKEIQVIAAKPLATAATAFLADRLLMGNASVSSNLAFAASTGTGVFVSDMIAKHTVGNSVGRSIEARVLEIGLTSAAAVATDAYLLGRNVNYNIGDRIFTIAVSEMAGEWLAQSFMMF